MAKTLVESAYAALRLLRWGIPNVFAPIFPSITIQLLLFVFKPNNPASTGTGTQSCEFVEKVPQKENLWYIQKISR